ncbi:hypothetical protein B0H14DRAFT_2616766 [Mycena olivaceomarginata]|nr:hypothetical protein B0H14DRAFT_2616766 [Mycena olivaceomarginata]
MCDMLSTSILFGTLPLLPGNRYIALGFVSAASIVYAANHQHPTCKLGRVEHKIQACEETLKHTKLNCMRNHLDLMDGTCRLLDVETWEKLLEYLQSLRDIMQKINQCAKDVKKIQTSTLLTIEAECQRQLFEGIKEVCEIRETIICSSACLTTTHAATRRSVIRNSSYEIFISIQSHCVPKCQRYSEVEGERRMLQRSSRFVGPQMLPEPRLSYGSAASRLSQLSISGFKQ